MSTKVCKVCGEEKSIKDFPTYRNTSSGLISPLGKCKKCKAVSDKEYYEKNKERLINQGIERRRFLRATSPEFAEKERLRKLKYRQENKEKIKAINKAYREKNRAKETEKVRNWRRNWSDEKKAIERKKRNERERWKRKNDPMFLIRGRVRGRIKDVFGFKGYKKSTKTEKMIGCTYDELTLHIQNQFKDGMTWENKGEWDVDHIIPLASANNVEELEMLCHYSNLQPLWEDENILKSDNYNQEDKEKYLKWYRENISK